MDEMSFGQWLSRQRKSLGLTQKQLAERVNCATITVRKIEAEQRHPSLQIIEQLAQVLNIPSKEHEGFLRFARGYRQYAPLDEVEARPWSSTSDSVNFNSRPFPVSIIEGRHRSSPGVVHDLDAVSEWFGMVGVQGNNDLGEVALDNQDTISDALEKAYLLLLVPIKMLDRTSLTILQALQASIQAGESASQIPIKPFYPNEIAELMSTQQTDPSLIDRHS